MNYVTQKDIEEINKLYYKMQKTPRLFSWNKLANNTKWSVTTVRKYVDENWYPGKYYQEPIKSKKVSDDLNYSGLYMLGQQVVQGNTILNLIKVGKAKNLKNRLRSYTGMNPFAYIIDTKEVDESLLNEAEQGYHKILGIRNQRYGRTEWFICNDEEYKYWQDKKLTLLGEH